MSVIRTDRKIPYANAVDLVKEDITCFSHCTNAMSYGKLYGTSTRPKGDFNSNEINGRRMSRKIIRMFWDKVVRDLIYNHETILICEDPKMQLKLERQSPYKLKKLKINGLFDTQIYRLNFLMAIPVVQKIGYHRIEFRQSFKNKMIEQMKNGIKWGYKIN